MIIENKEDERDEKLFHKRLKYLYKKINSNSSLFWTHENHLLGKRLRSDIHNEKSINSWKTSPSVQTGYGEITLGSFTNFINFLQNISLVLDKVDKDKIFFPAEKYVLNKNSLFLDIGSGFGKPVFHTAFQCNCESLGIEVVPARTEFCLDFYYEYLCNSNIFADSDFSKEEKTNINNSTFTSNLSIFEEKKLERVKLFNCPEGLIESILLENRSFFETTINKNFVNEDFFHSFFVTKPQGVSIDTFSHKFDEYFELNEVEIEKDNNYLNIEEKQNAEENLKNISSINNYKILDFLIFKNEFVDIIKDIPVKLSVQNNSEINNSSCTNILSEVTGLSKKKAFKTKKVLSKKDQIKAKKLFALENQEVDEELAIGDNISSGNNEENASGIIYNSSSILSELKACLSTTRFTYDENWWSNIAFECQDATKYKHYTNERNEHFTHIYCYNKIMGEECSGKIAKILNKTNFYVLAWYLNPKLSEKVGLKNVMYLCNFPMHTTSTEKFNVYIYIKIK